MGDQATGVEVRGRGQLLAAMVTVGAVIAAGVWLQRGVGTKALAGPPPPVAPSGAWFCPHGGGSGWQVTIEVANPGDHPVRIRVTELSDRRPGTPTSSLVPPGAEILVSERAPSLASSTMIEYFGGWVAASWVSRAGGGQSGIDAQPCTPAAGRRWLVPDGSTQLLQSASEPRTRRSLDSYVVVMNPFGADAIFSLTLYTDKDAPVRPGAWTNEDLKPFHAEVFHLNDQRLGYGTVSAAVDAKVGRVVSASLDVSDLGGVRSALGQSAFGAETAVLPGGFDQGRTELVVMNPTTATVRTTGTVLGGGNPEPISGPDGDRVNAESSQTFPVTTTGASSLSLRVPPGVAVARRTFGQSADSGATGPGVPARAWVLLPAVGGTPAHPGAVIANPGPSAIDVRLSYLPTAGVSAPQPITVHVPALETVPVPGAFVQARPLSAILAVSGDGRFVPAEASSSLGEKGVAAYAVALGVPIPDAWIPPAS